MIKFICEKCGKIWYTANTSLDQKCDDCGGFLEDAETFNKRKNINQCSNAN